MTFVEKNLSINDKIEGRAKLSLAALLVAWLSIPIFLVIFYISPLLSKAKKASNVVNSLGLGKEVRNILNSIPTGIVIFLSIPVIILVIVWICWGIITTKRHFKCELAYTNSHVLGICEGKSMITEFSEIKNVFVGQ